MRRSPSEDDDLPAGTLLFSEDFDSPASASRWVINQSQPVSQATFAYDYSADGIPPAPNSVGGTTLGLKFVSLSSVTAGISASPIGGNFAGDYRLRFDMWINYDGPLFDGGSQSTECFDAGIGTTGDHPNWDDTGADGVWFALTGDNGYSDDYEAWVGTSEQARKPRRFTRVVRGTDRRPTIPFLAATRLRKRSRTTSRRFKRARPARATAASRGMMWSSPSKARM